jgi:hypothetical protein
MLLPLLLLLLLFYCYYFDAIIVNITNVNINDITNINIFINNSRTIIMTTTKVQHSNRAT